MKIMPVKIAVVGLGGVGGFIGGHLARFYAGSPSVEVYFIARGETLRAVKERGLRVDTTEGSFVARPVAITDDASEIGKMDYVIYCTKSYDVEQGVQTIKPCLNEKTVIVPFLNGVDGTEQLRKLLPGNEVWDGCVYIFSQIESPGHIVENTGNYYYFFGHDHASRQRLDELNGIFAAAGVKAYAREDIEWQVWKKFGHISPMATLTSYTDKTYGEIARVPADMRNLKALLEEFEAVARAKGVEVQESLVDNVMGRMQVLPAGATTSMQRDFRAHCRTELEALTGYIVREGERLGVPVPTYRTMYDALATKVL